MIKVKTDLQSGLLQEDNLGLFADLYELTMGQADFEAGNDAQATVSYYIRKVPDGQYLISAGLEQIIHYIMNFRFSESDLSYLESCGLSQEYISDLADFKFKGNLEAIPEGTVIFPNEPIINITGSTREIQLFETYILSVMNFQTLIATKASRIKHVCQDRPFFDFGARRAHGRDAAMLAARAAYIGGASGTSLLSAGKAFRIPVVGTMAHKFISERDSEIEAFRAYAKAFPDTAVFLIDTYNTLTGAKNACIVAKEMEKAGHKLKAVRLDSGDLRSLSLRVRQMLDDNNLNYVDIIASNDLDEFKIAELIKENAPIDAFGVGTRLSTGMVHSMNHDDHGSVIGSSKPSALPGVFKLVESGGKAIVKKSNDDKGKATLPWRKTVYRISSEEGFFVEDHIVKKSPYITGKEAKLLDRGENLMKPILRDGILLETAPLPDIDLIRANAQHNLKRLPPRYKVMPSSFTSYPVHIDEYLKQNIS